MNIIQGDLISLASQGVFDVIVHGCNCQCTMSSGIAKSIKKSFPEAFEADCKTEKGSCKKLGGYSNNFNRKINNCKCIHAVTLERAWS